MKCTCLSGYPRPQCPDREGGGAAGQVRGGRRGGPQARLGRLQGGAALGGVLAGAEQQDTRQDQVQAPGRGGGRHRRHGGPGLGHREVGSIAPHISQIP